MDDRLFYAVETVVPGAIDGLDDVRLIHDTEVRSRGSPPKDSRGTVVAVHGDGKPFSVEFEEPFHASLLLEADQVEAIPGATRERLIAESERRDASHLLGAAGRDGVDGGSPGHGLSGPNGLPGDDVEGSALIPPKGEPFAH